MNQSEIKLLNDGEVITLADNPFSIPAETKLHISSGKIN